MNLNLKKIILLNILILVVFNILLFLYLKNINYTPKTRFVAHILVNSKKTIFSVDRTFISYFENYLLSNFSKEIRDLNITSNLFDKPFVYKNEWSTKIEYDLKNNQNGNLHLKKILKFLNSEIKNFSKIYFQHLNYLYFYGAGIQNMYVYDKKFVEYDYYYETNIYSEYNLIDTEYFRNFDFFKHYISMYIKRNILNFNLKNEDALDFNNLFNGNFFDDFYTFNEIQYSLDARRLNPTFINLMIFLSIIVISFINMPLFFLKDYKKFFNN